MSKTPKRNKRNYTKVNTRDLMKTVHKENDVTPGIVEEWQGNLKLYYAKQGNKLVNSTMDHVKETRGLSSSQKAAFNFTSKEKTVRSWDVQAKCLLQPVAQAVIDTEKKVIEGKKNLENAEIASQKKLNHDNKVIEQAKSLLVAKYRVPLAGCELVYNVSNDTFSDSKGKVFRRCEEIVEDDKDSLALLIKVHQANITAAKKEMSETTKQQSKLEEHLEFLNSWNEPDDKGKNRLVRYYERMKERYWRVPLDYCKEVIKAHVANRPLPRQDFDLPNDEGDEKGDGEDESDEDEEEDEDDAPPPPQKKAALKRQNAGLPDEAKERSKRLRGENGVARYTGGKQPANFIQPVYHGGKHPRNLGKGPQHHGGKNMAQIANLYNHQNDSEEESSGEDDVMDDGQLILIQVPIVEKRQSTMAISQEAPNAEPSSQSQSRTRSITPGEDFIAVQNKVGENQPAPSLVKVTTYVKGSAMAAGESNYVLNPNESASFGGAFNLATQAPLQSVEQVAENGIISGYIPFTVRAPLGATRIHIRNIQVVMHADAHHLQDAIKIMPQLIPVAQAQVQVDAMDIDPASTTVASS